MEKKLDTSDKKVSLCVVPGARTDPDSRDWWTRTWALNYQRDILRTHSYLVGVKSDDLGKLARTLCYVFFIMLIPHKIKNRCFFSTAWQIPFGHQGML